MVPQRTWRAGDEYWTLWIDATRGRYVAVRVGVVDGVEDDIVRLTNGDWRLLSEGLPFSSAHDAQRYAQEHPFEAQETAPESRVAPTTRRPVAARASSVRGR